jgi:hypothetical protein
MKVSIPNSIVIGAYQPQIVIKENLRDDGYNGSYNTRTGELNVEAVIFGEMRDRVFLHEILHVIAQNYEVQLDESDITRLANGLLEFLLNLGIEFDWSEVETIEQ